MYDFDQELFELLTPDEKTLTLNNTKLIKATEQIQENVSNSVDTIRRGRKVFEVTKISKDQIFTYKPNNSIALFRKKADGEFQEIDSKTNRVPIKPLLISRLYLISYENIEDQIPILGWFNFVTRPFAQIEDNLIVETLIHASNKNIEAETKGVLSFKDITNAKGKIGYPHNAVLVVNPFDFRDLEKESRRPITELLQFYQLKIMETNQIEKGRAILCDADKYSVSIFERKAISVRLFDYPSKGGIGVRITQRVIPIVLDSQKIVSITNC